MVILMIPIINFITVHYILYRTGQKVEGIQTAKIKTIEISDGRNIFLSRNLLFHPQMSHFQDFCTNIY